MDGWMVILLNIPSNDGNHQNEYNNHSTENNQTTWMYIHYILHFLLTYLWVIADEHGAVTRVDLGGAEVANFYSHFIFTKES